MIALATRSNTPHRMASPAMTPQSLGWFARHNIHMLALELSMYPQHIVL